MKKFLAMLLVLMLAVPAMAFADSATYEIALVTDVGNIDDKSFNEGCWIGVKQFAEENNISYNYYRPSEDSTEARVETIKGAIEKGAKTVVCPGFLFEETLYEVQGEYPDVNFLLIDGEPHDAAYNYETKPNTVNILFQEEQAGYLAGYAAVKDGYTSLGFLGGIAVPAVIRFGYGFVQGADAAAAEMDVDVEIKYWYCGDFSPSDAIKVKMDSWYAEGTEVVFACGGGIYLSALQAATEAGGVLIGVDKDQSFESELIITSAMKGLTESVVYSLTRLYENGGVWPEDMAGTTTVLGAANDAVGLPTAEDSWRLDTYTVEEYETLFAAIKSGEIVVSNATDVAPETTKVTVDYQE